jgi:signal peptidase I
MGRRLTAAIVTWLLGAGAGQLALGRWRAAIVLLLLDAIAWTAMIATALACWPRAFWWATVALFSFRLFATVHALRRMPEDREPRWSRVALLWGALVLVSAAQSAAIRGGLVEGFKIPAGSMLPTLEVGDHVMVDRRPRPIQRGDVIVFQYPPDPTKDFIKRVVAIGGDTIEIKDDALVLNGAAVPTAVAGPARFPDFDEITGQWSDRAYAAHDERLGERTYRVLSDDGARPPQLSSMAPKQVPPGHVFVLGDNRDNSHDSRYWGTVPLELVKGRALFLYWSSGPAGVRWQRIGKIIE